MVIVFAGILFCFLLYSAGAIVTRLAGFTPEEPGEKILFSYACGLGIAACYIYLCGVLKILYPSALYVLIGLLGVAAIIEAPGLLKRRPDINELYARLNKKKPFYFLIFFLVCVYLVIFALDVFMPCIDYDSLVYHLSYPKLFLEHNSILHTQAQGIDVPLGKITPMHFEMLYTIPLLFNSDIGCKFLQFATAVAALFALYKTGRTVLPPSAALLAVLIFISQPFLMRIISAAKVDAAILLYALLAVYAFFKWRDTGSNKWLAASGFGVSFYAACKLSGLLLGLFIGFGVCCVLLIERRFAIKNAIASLAIYIGCVLSIVSVWLIRSWIVTGDPVYPYLSWLVPGNFRTEISHVKSVMNFVLFPWDLTFRQDKFLYVSGISPFLLAFVPGIALIKGFDGRIKCFLCAGLAYSYAFFFLHVQPRYFILGIALLCVVAAYVIDYSSKWIKADVLRKALAVLLCLPFIYGFRAAWRESAIDLNILSGRYSNEEYLARNLGDYYKMAQYINKSLPKNIRIFTPYENRYFYIDRTLISGCWMVEKMLSLETKNMWLEFLKNTAKSEYVLLSNDYHQTLISLYHRGHLGYDPRDNVLHSEMMKEHMMLLEKIGGYSLYRI